jgi:cation-transporting ATPase 13A1
MSTENEKNYQEKNGIKQKLNPNQVNEEIESIRAYNFRPMWLHFNIAPFFIAYLIWLFVWVNHFGVSEYPELGLIVTVIIGLMQIVTCLFCYWFVEFRVFMQCNKETRADRARVVLVTPTANNGFAELVYLHHDYILNETNSFTRPTEKVTWFEFQKTKYLYDSNEKKQFFPIEFPLNNSLVHYLDSKGYSASEQQIKEAISYYGFNKMVMDIPKFVELFIERATAPFFVFQVFCVLLWCLDEYWYYSVFTLFMLVSFECTLVQQQLKNMQLIRQMGNQPFKIMVYRMRKWIRINSDELLPGDICSVGRNFGLTDNASSSPNNNQPTFSLPCDMLLLRGQCIVNESMLTGESVPVIKEPIENRNDMNDTFDIQADGKLHVLYGGTVIVQHTSPPKHDSRIKAQDNGCIAYVLRTGFNTSQGRLLRTIMYSVKRVTANNLETFLFILFLLIFAIAASSYVWIEGSKDPSRNRYKLLLECTLILTSVIPPELPIELALAVNTSLISLAKLGIFCTEPFRIPFAGKIDICCFDKTGTLTSDDLIVEGVAGLDDKQEITAIQDLPPETLYTLATCHTLINLDEELIGDPLEKVTLQAIEWTITKGDVVIAKKPKVTSVARSSTVGWKIYHRFHFSSTLKRMSVIAGHTKPGSTEISYIATCKGAPEVLKPMIKDLPSNYDEIYLHYAREGARVLCLGYKELGQLSHQQIRDMTREEAESSLKFAGFVIISCPLKPDTRAVIKEIMHSSHHITMITGDNPLTACHVGSQLKLIDKKNTYILSKENESLPNGRWVWKSFLDDGVQMNLHYEADNHYKTIKKNDCKLSFCLTGEGFDYLYKTENKYLKKIIANVKIFARVSPKQKEHVITIMKSLGYVTLMCGDGTNDVGALKHSEVGVALLSNGNNSEFEQKRKAKLEEAKSLSVDLKNNATNDNLPNQQAVINAQKKLNQVLKELEEADQAHIVKLGDASIASPFTYKQSSIQCVCHIIKQGRCTLVTTLQMFKILALNALILAYSQSVLYLDGIKFSDGQATMQGLLLAGCFLFISRSKPLRTLSKARPLPNIFNFYTVITVLGQFTVHLASLIYLVNEAHARSPPREEKFANLDTEFKPSLVNSTVYIISLSLQVATFAINYKGHPFMESLRQNKPLLYSILFSASAVVVLACRLMPEMSDQFQIVEFPEEVSIF